MSAADTGSLGDVANMAVIRFADIPGIEMLQVTGKRILGFAFIVWVVLEAYKLAQGERANFLRPIAHVGVAFVALALLPYFGDALAGLVQTLSDAMETEGRLALFGRSISTALHRTDCDIAWYDLAGLLFTIRGWIAILSSLVYLFMFLSKIVIIDVLFPVCFGLVLFLGVLSIPISAFPGMGGIKGWVKNLIEIALWPVVFQFLVALVAASYPLVIAAMANGQIVIDCNPAPTGTLSKPYAAGFFEQLQYLAICITYAVLVWFTPLLSSMVVRSAPAGMLGGVVAAKAGSMAKALAFKAVGGAFVSAAGKAAQQSGGSSSALNNRGGGSSKKGKP